MTHTHTHTHARTHTHIGTHIRSPLPHLQTFHRMTLPPSPYPSPLPPNPFLQVARCHEAGGRCGSMQSSSRVSSSLRSGSYTCCSISCSLQMAVQSKDPPSLSHLLLCVGAGSWMGRTRLVPRGSGCLSLATGTLCSSRAVQAPRTHALFVFHVCIVVLIAIYVSSLVIIIAVV